MYANLNYGTFVCISKGKNRYKKKAMSNKDLIKKFYTSFSKSDHQGMTSCYHNDVVFKDPAFGTLRNGRPAQMWEMLLSKAKGNISISFDNIQADENTGSATWTAIYEYGPKKRKVINNVSAEFTFQDGKIIQHTDTFDLWKWTKQAMGPVGYLLGWSSFIKSKIQKTTNSQLDAFIAKK